MSSYQTKSFTQVKENIIQNGRKIRPESLQVDPLLLQRMRDYELQSDDKRNYPVHFGEYAVGEDVVASDEARDAILDIFPKVIGVEMESYGVGLAATYKDMGGKSTPFIAIRGVCDFADPNKNDEYRLTALNNAAKFLVGIPEFWTPLRTYKAH